jgi:hypothetical protein
MLLVKKKIILAKINKKYVDRKIYIYEKNFKPTIFSVLMTMPKIFMRYRKTFYV